MMTTSGVVMLQRKVGAMVRAIDSINPCAIGVLILLVSTLIGSGKKDYMFKLGMVYILAVYVTYLLAGLGLTAFWSVIPQSFAEYIAMPATNVWHLDDNVSFDIGGIHDPMGNAFHTALTADIPGATVLVTGCGPIGIFAVGIFSPAELAHRAVLGSKPGYSAIGIVVKRGLVW